MTRVLCSIGALGLLCFAASIASAEEGVEADLTEMSLEELMNVEVTSVSKKTQNKNDAPAAIHVISSEDLRRGGFTSIPEALRTVPGVQVARIDANRWAISVRGFLQEFSNKLLVLIDGRTVYTPLFGGVYWDVQDYPIEDIARIEVIRGPGGTVWGANAVNGVINIITKNSEDTQGALVMGYGGNREYGGNARYGGKVGENTTYRVFAKGQKHEAYDFNHRSRADDEWESIRGGFRIDHEPSEKDKVRVSGDYYDVREERGLNVGVGFNSVHDEARGGNVLASWQRDLGDGDGLRVQAYYDRTYREARNEEDRHIADVEFQHDLNPMDDVSVSWGGNYRFSTSHSKAATSPLQVDPNDEDFHLGSGFLQVQVDFFDEKLSLIAGTKLNVNNWSGFEYQPSGRALYKPVEGHTFWGGVSRAVRTPTQVDRDLQTTIGGATLLGDRNQRSEELVSLEFGYRFFQFERVTAEISTFYSFYESGSTLVATSTPGTFQFANPSEFKIWGGEAEVNFLPFEWWRVTIGYSMMQIDEDGPPNPLGTGGVKKQNPQHQFMARTFVDLPWNFEIDAALYYMDGLPGVVPAQRTDNISQYVRLDLRLGYTPTDWLELALVGQNLTDPMHPEFYDVQRNQSSQIPRTFYGKATFRF